MRTRGPAGKTRGTPSCDCAAHDERGRIWTGGAYERANFENGKSYKEDALDWVLIVQAAKDQLK